MLVGQRLGENDPETAERGVWTAATLAIPFMALMGLLVAVFPEASMAAFANYDKPVEWSHVRELMPALSGSSPFIRCSMGWWCFFRSPCEEQGIRFSARRPTW